MKEFYPSSEIWGRVEEGIINESISFVCIITDEGKEINIWGEDLIEKYKDKDPSPESIYQYIKKTHNIKKIIYIQIIDNNLGDMYYIKEKYIPQIEEILKEKIRIVREGKEKYIIFE